MIDVLRHLGTIIGYVQPCDDERGTRQLACRSSCGKCAYRPAPGQNRWRARPGGRRRQPTLEASERHCMGQSQRLGIAEAWEDAYTICNTPKNCQVSNTVRSLAQIRGAAQLGQDVSDAARVVDWTQDVRGQLEGSKPDQRRPVWVRGRQVGDAEATRTASGPLKPRSGRARTYPNAMMRRV